MVIVVTKKAKVLIHPIDRTWEVFRFCPHRMVANIYLGCEFACAYCFARSIYPEYHEIIIARINAAEKIDKEIVRLKKRGVRQPVDLGSATDPYQPIEEKLELTRKVLTEFLKHKMPVFVVTKSDLVLRDLDIIKALREEKLALVQFSLPTLDNFISQNFEGGSPAPEKRLRAIEELAEEGIRVIVRVQPVIPFINDHEEMLREVIEAASAAGAQHVIAGTLKLSETVLNNLSPVLKKFNKFEKFLRFYVADGEIDSSGYLIPPHKYRLQILSTLAKLTMKYKMTFGTCKEGFFDLHSHRCSGLDLNATYVPTIEHIIKYLRVKGKITLEEAIKVLKRLGANAWYIRRFKKGWHENILFSDLPEVIYEKCSLRLK